ncbi:hypothetical protein F2Q69_00026169 [Brassica cretica]|uniref:Uncharacterized protein n=1 Tax=Brassica cretica TaxID=69181 RepID=A0A8S9RVP2_BRACR|nr:hypothetical protein F2Q69_00026169 [Brassica cretica]
MANVLVLLSDLQSGRSSSTIEVRLLRFWEAKNVRRGGELMGVDIILLDSQFINDYSTLWKGKMLIGKEALFVIMGLKRLKIGHEKLKRLNQTTDYCIRKSLRREKRTWKRCSSFYETPSTMRCFEKRVEAKAKVVVTEDKSSDHHINTLLPVKEHSEMKQLLLRLTYARIFLCNSVATEMCFRSSQRFMSAMSIPREKR